MITAKIVHNHSIKVTPAITFPFLWRGPMSDNVYLRFASRDIKKSNDVDLCLIPSRSTPVEVASTGTTDGEAWECRLSEAEAVTIHNVAV